MRETWLSFRCFASRFKLIAALLALFGAGALIAVGTCAWYYNAALSRQQMAYEGQIERLAADVGLERDINRTKLESLADELDEISDSIGRLLAVADEATKAAKTAATTAKSAASTASSAAKNAAQSRIRISEVKPDERLRLK